MNAQTIQDYTTAVLAVILFGGTVGLIIYQSASGHPVAVPDVLSNLDFAAAGAYFVNQASRNGARQAGTAAVQTAVASQQAFNQGVASVTPPPPPPPPVASPPA